MLVGRGHTYTAMLLLTLVLIPPQWIEMWWEAPNVSDLLAALVLSLYTFILVAHWLAFLFPAARFSR